MTSPEGGFYSAEDADSPLQPGTMIPVMAKGGRCLLRLDKQEVDDALGDEAPTFSSHYGVEENGNVPAGADPHGELRGKNILIRGVTSAVGRTRRGEAVGATPKTFAVGKKDAENVQKSLAESRQKLFSIRSKRPRPHLDDKIIAAWNGLMISAFARGAQILNDASYLETATQAAEFVGTRLYDESRQILFRSYREGRSEIEGFADDYAFFIQGLIDLYHVLRSALAKICPRIAAPDGCALLGR